MVRRKKSSKDYKALLDRINNLDLGSGTHFIPKEGRNVVRVIPALSEGGFFFEEARSHYHGKTNYLCPNVATEGKLECPCCEANELLYQDGNKDAASDFRGSPKFYMNIINRDAEDDGPKIYACPKTVFSAICAVIHDPDYGDVTDEEDGTDIVITRTGKGLETKYQVMPRKNATVLGTEEQMDMWFDDAADLVEYIDGKLLDYDEMAGKTGAAVYLDEDYDGEEKVEEAEEQSSSDRIRQRLADRKSAGANRGSRSRKRPSR